MPTSGPRGGSGERHKDHKRWSRSRSRSPRSWPYEIIKSPNIRRDKVRRKRSCLRSGSGSRSAESSGMEGGRRERPRRHVLHRSIVLSSLFLPKKKNALSNSQWGKHGIISDSEYVLDMPYSSRSTDSLKAQEFHTLNAKIVLKLGALICGIPSFISALT